MKQKYTLISISVLIIIVIGFFYFRPNQQPYQNEIVPIIPAPSISNSAFYSIHEIKLNTFNSGTYNTEGYVIKQFTCGRCPPGAQCKVCMGNNIVISENNILLDTYTLTDTELILFTNIPSQFELGKKYKFSINILDKKSTGEPINDIELVSYSLPENPIVPSSIIGTWEVTSVTARGAEIVYEGNGATINFMPDGTYKALGGCNRMSIREYKIEPDSKMSLTVGGTQMACMGNVVEFWTLEKVYSYELIDNFLLLHYKTNGGRSGYFKLKKIS